MTKPFRHLRVSIALLTVVTAAVAAVLLTAGPAAAAGSYTCPPNTGADVQLGINDGGTVYIHGTCHGNFYVDATSNASNVTLIGLGVNPTLNGDGNGPVLSIYGPANVTIKNLTLTNGNAEVGGGIDAFFSCGNSCGDPFVNVIGSKITGNTASEGGGVFAEAGFCETQVNITNSTVSKNSATDGSGGGLAIVDCAATAIAGTTVTQNTAAGYGGGLELDSADPSSVDSSTFSTNIAQNESGGGIDSFVTDLQVTNSRLLGNWAYAYGGGIDAGDAGACRGELRTQGAASATAHQHTRALSAQCVGAPGNKAGVGQLPAPIPFGLTVAGTTLDHNTAAHFGGGGIENFAYEGDSPATITNSTISNNIAPGNDNDGDSGGGGIHQDSCDPNASLTIAGTKIYGNTAMSSMGGGISNMAFCDGGADVSLANTLLQNPNSLSPGNQAKWGGGIYNAFETATVSIQAQSRVVKNRATVTGGGVYDDCGAGLFVAAGALVNFNMPNNIFTSAGCLISD